LSITPLFHLFHHFGWYLQLQAHFLVCFPGMYQLPITKQRLMNNESRIKDHVKFTSYFILKKKTMNAMYVTEKDFQRLFNLIQEQRRTDGAGTNIAKLSEELKRAKRLPAEEIPVDVVTMNSRVHVKELKSGNEMEVTLVYPKNADVKAKKISVLAPLGAAILGYREGDQIEWSVPNYKFTYKIEKVLYQPEAAGDYHL
jgi:regulator of nucleoside diphosphate kinase